MTTFLEHIVPGLALSLLGLWHTINTTRSYYNNNNKENFTVKFWHPLVYGSSSSRLKRLEPLIILSFSILALFNQILDLHGFHFTFHLIKLEHATMFLHLAVFSGFTLCTETSMSTFTGILAASVFSQELFLLHFHSADHVGLEGHYHWLLQLIILVSLLASLASTFAPSSFAAALILSISVVFQGCWFMNMGCVLWLPKFTPEGCFFKDSPGMMHSSVVCGSPRADVRARAMANLQFSWILSGIMVLTGCICLKSAGRSNRRRLEYEQLNSRVHKHIKMRSLIFLVTLVFGATTILIIITAGPSTGIATVHVTNLLSSEYTVIVHCQSKEDDLKARTVQSGSQIEWSFDPNFRTLFWCDLALRDMRLHFDAFQKLKFGIGGYCESTHWVVKDAGVHRNSTVCHGSLFLPWIS
ncbi:S-protein homolog 2 [Linum grandiflorum]